MGHGHFLNSTGRHEHFLNSTCKIRTPPPPRQGPHLLPTNGHLTYAARFAILRGGGGGGRGGLAHKRGTTVYRILVTGFRFPSIGIR